MSNKDLNKQAEAFSKAAMSVSRKDFKRAIENVLAGAVVEFMKCRINDKLNLNHRDREHWEKEWRYHLGVKMMSRFNYFFRFRDLNKACEEVLFETSTFMDQAFRRSANIMAKYLNRSPSKMLAVLDPKDAADFMSEAKQAIQVCLDIEAPIPAEKEQK